MEAKEEQEESSRLLNPDELTSEITPTMKRSRSVRTKVPEVEVKVYRQGKGPIAEFKSSLGGWDQDQLEVRDIMEQYGFKTLYAFNSSTSTRAVPIRFHPRNGRSLLPYKDGSIICVDGEPKVLLRFAGWNTGQVKSLFPYLSNTMLRYSEFFMEDSLIKPITRIVVGVVLITVLITLVVTESPAWAEKFNMKGFRIPPWLLTCAIIVFIRMRKRTKDFLQKRGWC